MMLTASFFYKAHEPKSPEALHRRSLIQMTHPRGNPKSLSRKPALAGQHTELGSPGTKTWYIYTGFHSKPLAM